MRRLIHFVYEHLRTLVLVPHPQAIGTASEEVYFALLAARRTNRRLLVLFPTPMPWPLRMRNLPTAFFDLRSPQLWCSPAARRLLPLRFGISCYFGLVRLIGLSGLTRRKGVPQDSEVGIPKGGQDLIWTVPEAATNFDLASVERLNWPSQYEQPLSCEVAAQTELVGRAALAEFGISERDWWVCFHVREPGFYEDYSSSQYRNGSISSYLGAIEVVTAMGGWVIRLGDPTMEPLPPLKHVVDIAHSQLRSPRLDAYVLRNCTAFIGMQSGVMDSAILFERPLLITNMYGWLIGLPYMPNSWGMFQHLTDKSTGAPVSVDREMLGTAASLTSDWGCAGVTYGALSEEELTAGVHEFLEWVNLECPELPSKMVESRRKAFLSFLENNKLRMDEDFDVTTKYRLASRATASAFGFRN